MIEVRGRPERTSHERIHTYIYVIRSAVPPTARGPATAVADATGVAMPRTPASFRIRVT